MFTRRSGRARGAWLLAVSLAVASTGTPAGAAGKLTPEQKAALEVLAAPDAETEACKTALDALAGVDDRKALERVLEFGLETWNPALTQRVGAMIAALGPEASASLLDRAHTKAGGREDHMTRLVRMADMVPGKPGTAFLTELLGSTNEPAAALAARSLGARKEEEARKPLEGALRSGRGMLAAAAAHALASLPPDDALRDLLFQKVTTASKDGLGDHCALALSTMEGAAAYGRKAVDMASQRAKSDSFHALAKLAIWTLPDIEPAKLLNLMDHQVDDVRELGCDLAGLTACKDAKVQQRLLTLGRTSREWRIRVPAWLALRRTGAEHVAADVAQSIAAQKDEESHWAIQCAIHTPNEVYLPALRKAALDTKDPVRRELAAQALAAHPQRAETRDFLAAAGREATSAPVRAAAYMSLGALQDNDTFDVLLAHLSEKDQESAKLVVLKGLERLTGHYYKPDPEVWRIWRDAVGGEIAYVPMKADRRKDRAERSALTERGITPATEAAVEAGLQWFAVHQDPDGIWNGATFDEHCPSRDCRQEGGHRDRELAYTGLACLAYLGAGYDHLDGPYRDVVRRGFEAILARQAFDGSHEELSWTFSYEAAIVCHALNDAYALTGDAWLRRAAQRSLDYLVKIQFPGGAWRYHIRSSETDTSIMSWVLLAAVSARSADLDVPEQVFVSCENWFERATDPLPPGEFEVFEAAQFKGDGRYGVDVRRDDQGKVRTFKLKTWYQPPRLYTPAMPAINLLARIWLGRTRAHPVCLGNANQVVSQIPGYGVGLEKEFAFYPYTFYYGSLAMFQMGGEYWRLWRTKCIEEVVKNQNRTGHLRGSWTTPRGEFFAGLNGGRMFCTAMCIMTLETFYRYQPYLSRHSTRGTSKEEREGTPPDGEKPEGEGGK